MDQDGLPSLVNQLNPSGVIVVDCSFRDSLAFLDVFIPKWKRTGRVDLNELTNKNVLENFKWKDHGLWARFWQACANHAKPYLLIKPARFTKKGEGTGPGQYLVYQVEDFCPKTGNYKLSWVNYEDSENTWEPRNSLSRPSMCYCWRNAEAWTKCCQYYAANVKPKLCTAADVRALMDLPALGIQGPAQTLNINNVQASPIAAKPHDNTSSSTATTLTDSRGSEQPDNGQIHACASTRPTARAGRLPLSWLPSAQNHGRLVPAGPTETEAGPSNRCDDRQPRKKIGRPKGSKNKPRPPPELLLPSRQVPSALAPAPVPLAGPGIAAPTGAGEAAGANRPAAAITYKRPQHTSPLHRPVSQLQQSPNTRTSLPHRPREPAASLRSKPLASAYREMAQSRQQLPGAVSPPALHSLQQQQQPPQFNLGQSGGQQHLPTASQHELAPAPNQLHVSQQLLQQHSGPAMPQYSPSQQPVQPAHPHHGHRQQLEALEAHEELSDEEQEEQEATEDGEGRADMDVDDETEESSLPEEKDEELARLHVQQACDHYLRLFRSKFPRLCKRDGYFICLWKQELRKGKLVNTLHVERAKPNQAAQLAKPPSSLYPGVTVVDLTDPCDPCYNNPYVRGDASCCQKGVVAAKAFAMGDVVLFYEGELITKADNNLWGPRDEWDLDTPEHAYTMPVSWTEDGMPQHEILTEGTLACPAVRVNHEHYWGKCGRPASSCNCHLYAQRSANVEVTHGFKISQGKLHPLTWFAAKRDVQEGEEILTYWAVDHLDHMGHAYVRSKLIEQRDGYKQICQQLKKRLLDLGEELESELTLSPATKRTNTTSEQAPATHQEADSFSRDLPPSPLARATSTALDMRTKHPREPAAAPRPALPAAAPAPATGTASAAADAGEAGPSTSAAAGPSGKRIILRRLPAKPVAAPSAAAAEPHSSSAGASAATATTTPVGTSGGTAHRSSEGSLAVSPQPHQLSVTDASQPGDMQLSMHVEEGPHNHSTGDAGSNRLSLLSGSIPPSAPALELHSEQQQHVAASDADQQQQQYQQQVEEEEAGGDRAVAAASASQQPTAPQAGPTGGDQRPQGPPLHSGSTEPPAVPLETPAAACEYLQHLEGQVMQLEPESFFTVDAWIPVNQMLVARVQEVDKCWGLLSRSDMEAAQRELGLRKATKIMNYIDYLMNRIRTRLDKQRAHAGVPDPR